MRVLVVERIDDVCPYSSPGISFVGFKGKLVGHTKHSLAALFFPSSKGAAVIKAEDGHTQF